MKICRITSAFPPPWEGLAPGPYELSLAQAKSGHELTVITKYSKGCEHFDREAPYGFCKDIHFYVKRVPAYFDIEFSFRAYKKLLNLKQINSFDIVHGHGFSSLGILFAKKFTTFRTPVVTTIHCVRHTQRRYYNKVIKESKKREKYGPIVTSRITLFREIFQERFIVKNSDMLIAVSKGIKKDLVNAYGISPDRVYVSGNGVNTERFSPIKKIFMNEVKKLNILWVGRFSDFKGERDLIYACNILREKRINFQLVMIGDGDGSRQASQYIIDQYLGNNIEIIPNIPNTLISEYYRNAHIFILPSVSEGMPKVVLEAMACGCPIIVSDIPGCRELVKSNKNGFLVPTGRPDILAKTIISFCKNPALIRKMGQNSRRIVENEYTWDCVSKRLDHVYEGVLKKRI